MKLSRRLFDNKIWQAAREFSECEAWIDLIQSARFEASPTTSFIGGCQVTWTRGQYPASIRFLSKKWGRPERWVRRVLKAFKAEGMITINNASGVNIITLVNYEKYNGSTDGAKTIDDTPQKTVCDTGSDTGSDTLNNMTVNELRELVTQLVTQVVTHPPKKRHTPDTNNKKEEEYKEILSSESTKKDAAVAATLSRKDQFYESLVPYVGRYPKDMIRAFYDYWTEMNRSRTKMRFEQQPTWELAKRLVTWANKDKAYGNRKQTPNAYEQKQADSDRRKTQLMEEFAQADRDFIARQQAAHASTSQDAGALPHAVEPGKGLQPEPSGTHTPVGAHPGRTGS